MLTKVRRNVSVFCAMALAFALAGTAFGQVSKAAAGLPPLSGHEMQQLLASCMELVASQVRSFDTVSGAHQYILDGAGMQESMWQANTGIRPPGLETLPEFKVAKSASSAKDAPATSSVITSK